jgi:hypothetical protein
MGRRDLVIAMGACYGVFKSSLSDLPESSLMVKHSIKPEFHLLSIQLFLTGLGYRHRKKPKLLYPIPVCAGLGYDGAG